MDDHNGKGTRDQDGLLKVPSKGEAGYPYCGFRGDPEALEEILWSYAEGELPPVEEETLEEHTDACQYCSHRLAMICQSLEAVEGEPGYSRDKVQALLAGTGAQQRVGRVNPAGQGFQAVLEFMRQNWRPLSTMAAALVVIISLVFLFPARRGPVPLGEFLTSAGRPAVPDQVAPRHMAGALSPYLDQLWEEPPVRALLPGARPHVAASFMSLGFLFQHLETLADFSPLKGSLRIQADSLAQDMETVLRALVWEGPLYQDVTLYHARLLSGLYGPEELETVLNRVQGLLFLLADSPEFRAWKARQALELGMWLSHLNRDLSLAAQGFDREKELRALFLPEYVETLQEYCPLYLPADVAPVLDPALEIVKTTAKEAQTRRLSPQQARVSLRAVMDIVGCAVR